MNIRRTIKWSILAFFLCVSVIASGFLVFRVSAQDQTIDDLHARLIEKGIPIKSMTTDKRIPFVVKIDLQSKSDGKDLQPEDLYYEQIARKAATLFYRHGQKIDGYELEVVNSKGEQISWESNNIWPSEYSQQSLTVIPSKLTDKDTSAVLQSNLNLHGLTVKQINVLSDRDLGDAGQEISLQLTTPDLNTANQDLIPFLLSLHSSLDTINTKYGTRISIIWIQAFDKENQQLLNYVWDVETREETSLQIPGLAAWYSVPAPEKPASTPTLMPSAPAPNIPSPNVAYPPPGPTPTNHPYP